MEQQSFEPETEIFNVTELKEQALINWDTVYRSSDDIPEDFDAIAELRATQELRDNVVRVNGQIIKKIKTLQPGVERTQLWKQFLELNDLLFMFGGLYEFEDHCRWLYEHRFRFLSSDSDLSRLLRVLASVVNVHRDALKLAAPSHDHPDGVRLMETYEAVMQASADYVAGEVRRVAFDAELAVLQAEGNDFLAEINARMAAKK